MSRCLTEQTGAQERLAKHPDSRKTNVRVSHNYMFHLAAIGHVRPAAREWSKRKLEVRWLVEYLCIFVHLLARDGEERLGLQLPQQRTGLRHARDVRQTRLQADCLGVPQNILLS